MVDGRLGDKGDDTNLNKVERLDISNLIYVIVYNGRLLCKKKFFDTCTAH